MELDIDEQRLEGYRRELATGVASGPVRWAFAAAHVVLRETYRGVPHSVEGPVRPEEIAEYIDWPATLDLRRHLAHHGFGIAEAMDTAQRFSLGWPAARRLIEECGKLELAHGFVAGAGVDHLPRVATRTQLIDGVVHQASVIRRAGGLTLLLPLPWLVENASSEADFVEVYGAIIRELEGPLFVHWLGAMFLPQVRGYFPGESFTRIMELDPSKVRGAKISLLDPPREIAIRRRLLAHDQIVLSGDDFHFPELIRGEPEVIRTTQIAGTRVALGDFSHALMGILDAIAAPAALALRFLARGDAVRYHELMDPCGALGRWIFSEPTQYYKGGLAFLAWLNGLQDNFLLVNHEEQQRDRTYYRRTAELAAAAGALTNAPLARRRLAGLARRLRRN